jgi:site-specific recombinase XerD
MRAAGDGIRGARVRGLIVVLWRAGLRIHEALLLTEHDLDARRGAIVVRRGKGGRRRESGWTIGVGSTSHRGSNFGRRCRTDRCSA